MGSTTGPMNECSPWWWYRITIFCLGGRAGVRRDGKRTEETDGIEWKLLRSGNPRTAVLYQERLEKEEWCLCLRWLHAASSCLHVSIMMKRDIVESTEKIFLLVD